MATGSRTGEALGVRGIPALWASRSLIRRDFRRI
jgi:hypothetical protein